MVMFGPKEDMGFEYNSHLLAYSVGGFTSKVDCIVVVSSSHSDVLEGDILVSINNIPLINNSLLPYTTQLSYARQTMTDQSHGSRQLVLLRSDKGNGYDPSYNMTIFSMTPNEAALIHDDSALVKLHDDERRAFELRPASVRLFSVTIPYEQSSLGLNIQVQSLQYLNQYNDTVKIDACVVLDSAYSSMIHPGDVVVKVNYDSVVRNDVPLVQNDAETKAFFDNFLRVVNEAERPLKVPLTYSYSTLTLSKLSYNMNLSPLQITFMRPSSGVSEEGLSPRLLVQLSEEMETKIFASSPLSALSEDEEIARRLEEELYRIRKEKDARKKIEDDRKFREDELKRAEEAEVTTLFSIHAHLPPSSSLFTYVYPRMYIRSYILNMSNYTFS